MIRIYIDTGKLKKSDPLYKYISRRKFRTAAGMVSSPTLYVERLKGSHDIYHIIDEKSHGSLILKSYAGCRGHERNGKKEYDRIQRARHICGHSHYHETIAPIGIGGHGMYLLEKYVSGENLGRFMERAFSHGNDSDLYDKLLMVAGYLSDLHRKGSSERPVDTGFAYQNIKKHARQAYECGAVDIEGLKQMLGHARSWREALKAWSPNKCLTHGDVTPANFIFHGKKMYAIDLERSAYRDPAHDTGILAGELFHYALTFTGNPYNADRFIGHFYWMYAGNFERQQDKFIEMTGRNPFYMANSLLRISRNPGLGYSYKKALGYYALECLKSLPRYRIVR